MSSTTDSKVLNYYFCVMNCKFQSNWNQGFSILHNIAALSRRFDKFVVHVRENLSCSYMPHEYARFSHPCLINTPSFHVRVARIGLGKARNNPVLYFLSRALFLLITFIQLELQVCSRETYEIYSLYSYHVMAPPPVDSKILFSLIFSFI